MFCVIALSIVVVLILAGLSAYIYPSRRDHRSNSVPGLVPSSKNTGNIPDILSAGSLHEFLTGLHAKFGPVASFWLGPEYVVSTAGPAAFRKQMKFFDRPKCLFEKFEPLMGSASVLFQNGESAKEIRRKTDPYFSHENCSRLLPKFIDIANELKETWLTRDEPGRPLALQTFATTLALKGIIATIFGDELKDDDACVKFGQDYYLCFNEMESRIDGHLTNPDSVQEKRFQTALHSLRSTVSQIIDRRKDQFYAERYLVDELIDASGSEQEALDNVVTYVVAGQHTTAITLTWMIYYLASNPDCLAKAAREVLHVIGPRENPMLPEHHHQLQYCRQIVDETLRFSVLAPSAARIAETDLTLDGHAISKETILVQAFGVGLQNPDYWPDPDGFNPDNFAEQPDHKIDPLTCPFFGFAGKRKCPGYRLSYFEFFAFLSVLLRNFRITLADPGQIVKPRYGLVTSPLDDIFVHVEPI